MAKLVVIDGPEKAGKTTLITSLILALEANGQHVMRLHWSKPEANFHSFIYRDEIERNIKSTTYDVIIWDRSWVSEYVYPGLMPHMRSNRRTTWADPWISEWCFGRALQTYGMGLILLGPSERQLEELRDDTDWPCPVFAERRRFGYYGHTFGWDVIENPHNQTSDGFIVRKILTRLAALDGQPGWLVPPAYCGPVNAKVVFMAEELSSHRTKQTWLPFSSKYPTQLGREFGNQAFNFGWTNARDMELVPRSMITHGSFEVDDLKFFDGKLVVACGDYAANYCKTNGLDYYRISHPSYGFRWGKKVEEYNASVKLLKSELAGRGVYFYGESEAKDQHSVGAPGSAQVVAQ